MSLSAGSTDDQNFDKYLVLSVNVTRVKRVARYLATTAKGLCLVAGGSSGAITLVGLWTQR